MSITQALYHGKSTASIGYLQAVRNSEGYGFEYELRAIANDTPRYRLHVLFREPAGDDLRTAGLIARA